MPMTDLADLTLPTWAVPSQPRQTAVDEHTVRIREQWWHEKITSRGLPGTPPIGPTLTRAQVTSAAETSRHDPTGAYQLMRPGRHNAIRSLGPSFFTKFLYFAGGGAQNHPCWPAGPTTPTEQPTR
jgi:hypothetical protein